MSSIEFLRLCEWAARSVVKVMERLWRTVKCENGGCYSQPSWESSLLAAPDTKFFCRKASSSRVHR